MKRFKFTLLTLLNVKISQEKQKTSELAEQNRIIMVMEQEMVVLRKRLTDSSDEYNRKMEQGGMSAGDVAVYSAGIKVLYDKIAEQMDRIRRAVAVKEKITAELVGLMGERKMLENLREKQYQEYLEESRREEAKILDDFMTTKISGEMDNG